jgi:regulator of protease activity HflC (stomatin/prohibitin superfamily)
MNARTAVIAVVVLVVLMFGGRFVKTIPPGHVGVAVLFGEVQQKTYPEGMNIPVNPFYNWVEFDVRQTTLKESAQVPTRDQLQTKVDMSVQFRVDADMAPSIFKETGDVNRLVAVHLVPVLRSMLREQGSKVAAAEDFFQEATRDELAAGLLDRLKVQLRSKGLIIQDVLIRDINLPAVLTKAIEQKKEREQAVQRQKAELDRFRMEQQQQVAAAEAKFQAAEEEAKQIRVLAKARADEIRLINDAVAKNPAYIKLQALEALKQIAKDPATKIYFLDSNSPQPLPLLHMGEGTGVR